MTKKITGRLLQSTFLAGAVAFSAVAGTAVTSIAPAVAQDATSGALTGQVTDASGAPLAGATVTLVSSDRGFTRTATTNSNGLYRLPQLPVGSYVATVSADGYQGVVNENIRISLSSTAAFNATLAPSVEDGGDEIVVIGQAQSISAFDANTTGLTVDVTELANKIPVPRNIGAVALLAPGTAETDGGFTAGTNRGASATQIGISGSSVGENQFFINGFNISDFNDFIGAAVVPFEFYDQVEVKTGGVSAEFGRATGGFVNATTKSGSNEFEGGFAVYWSPDELRSTPDTTYKYDSTGTDLTPLAANYLDETDELEANLFLSGPIIEDKLFFYALYAPKDDSQLDIVNTQAFLETNKSAFYGGKLDYFLTDSQHFEYTYFKDEETYSTDIYDAEMDADGFQTGVDFGSEVRTEELTTGGDNHIFKYQGQFTDWFTLSASYGSGTNLQERAGSNSSGVFAVIDDVTGERLTNYAVGLVEKTTNERKAYRVDADIFASFLGEHQFRIGYDREELTATFDDKYAGPEFTFTGTDQFAGVRGAMPIAGGLYAMTNQGAAITVTDRDGTGAISEFEVRARVADGFFETNNEAYYIQDAWTVHPDVVLNLGLRAETFSNSNADGEVFFETDTLVSPRLGVNWDVFGDSSLQLGAFSGRYYLPVATNTNFRLAGNERDVTTVFTPDAGFDLNALLGPDGAIQNATVQSTSVNSDGITDDTRESVSANLKPQYVDEIILSANHLVNESSPLYFGGLFDEWSFGLSYTYREMFDALEDAAVDAAVLDYCDENGIAGCEGVWSGFHHYVLINPGSDIEYATDDLPGSTPGDFTDITISGDFLPAAERVYHAISLDWERPFDGKWSFRGNYTWSDLEGNYEGSVKSDIAQTDAGLTQDFDQPGLMDGASGKLPQHRAHQLKLWGNYAITDNLLLGANYRLTSPREFGCLGHHPTDGFAALYGAASFYCLPEGDTGRYFTPIPSFGYTEDFLQSIFPTRAPGSTASSLTPRGSQLESDWISNLNLSMSYTPPAADGRLNLRVDVFNVFNSQAVTDLNEIGTTGSWSNYGADPNYGLARSYQAPRTVRLGLRYNF